MTNTSFYNSPTLPKKHNHVEIIFKNLRLVYNDPRRFGYILLNLDKKYEHKCLKILGYEPLSKDCNANNIANILCNKERNIKNVLMDQKIISTLYIARR